jgi:precorrin-3B C17-methyltransferase
MGNGSIFVVGLGPGSKEYRTIRAQQALEEADVIVGYNTYLKIIRDVTEGKEVIGAKMKEELFRARITIEKALEGKKVALVSSGDPQVYGMASLLLDMMAKHGYDIPVEIIPGVTAALAVSSKLGSPLSLDYASISLSDLLIPRDEILNRVRKAAEGDFVIVLYNPISKPLLEASMDIIREIRKNPTPVGIVDHGFREDEKVIITDTEEWKKFENVIGMVTTIVAGNSKTYVTGNKMITPRGYERKYSY